MICEMWRLLTGRLIIAWLLLLSMAQPGYGVFSNKFAGPYEIIVRQMARCADEGTNQLRLEGNKIRKYNRTTFLYSTDIAIPIKVDDEVKMAVQAAVFGNGGWKENYFRHEIGGVCTSLFTYAPGFAKDLLKKAFNLEKCPIQKGNYTATDIVLHLDLKWPSIPYNRYRYDFFLSHKGIVIGCKRIFLDVVPKSNKS